MKKLKWIIPLLIVVSLVTGVIGCKDLEVEHQHQFTKKWEIDEYYHWKKCNCGEIDFESEHSFCDWQVITAATEEAEGAKERSCTVCGYTTTEVIEKLAHTHKFAESLTKDETHHWYAAICEHTTEVSEKAEHTFGDWTITKATTEEAEGTKERSCTVCGYTATEVIEKLAHTHKFATDWTKDETHHWYASTCEHTTEVSGKAEHSFGEYVSNNDATTGADGTKTRECSVCGYKDTVTDEGSKIIVPEGFELVEGTTITGTENWIPTSKVFVSGRKLTIPNLLVSDHEVTRGEYKAVMGSDPSTANAYDKDGNELEGDDVLNNPVNDVNWYDALVYCNKLSMQENLTPCYSIDGSTDPDDWGEVPTSINSTWDAATCDFNANGYRLPTEAEWEWLARGEENYIYAGYIYAGSDNVDDVAWYTSNTNDTGTREVKTKAPNGYGLYDMSGNVWEWCWDWYGSISSSSAADGATSGGNRVQRGGSWCSGVHNCQVANRYTYIPSYRYSIYGFRVVRPSSK